MEEEGGCLGGIWTKMRSGFPGEKGEDRAVWRFARSESSLEVPSLCGLVLK